MDNLLLSCVQKRNIKKLKYILEKNINHITRRDMLQASVYAASMKAEDILNVFLSRGLHINEILVRAVRHPLKNAIDVLHKMGGDVNHEHDGYLLVTIAAIHHNTECIETLLQYGAQLNLQTVDGETCLACIARYPSDYTNEIQYLVAKGADVNLPNNTGETPLHFAAEYGNTSTLCSLLSVGAQVNHRNNSDETALMMASREHHEQCVHSLLQNAAEHDLQSLKGDTALMKNIKTRYYKQPSYGIINLLLENGCNVNICDNEGLTPLFLAVQLDERIIITKLLECGADISTETNYGMTPFLASIITGYDKLTAQLIHMECFISRNHNWKQRTPLVGLMALALSTTINIENSETLNQLFFGAGETIPIERIHQPHAIAILATKIKHETLMSIIRQAIRLYLSNICPVNLITQITKLPLPISLKKFLYFS